jgi:hypothetical protein
MGELDFEGLDQLKRSGPDGEETVNVEEAARLIEARLGIDIRDPGVQGELLSQLRALGVDVNALRSKLR